MVLLVKLFIEDKKQLNVVIEDLNDDRKLKKTILDLIVPLNSKAKGNVSDIDELSNEDLNFEMRNEEEYRKNEDRNEEAFKKGDSFNDYIKKSVFGNKNEENPKINGNENVTKEATEVLTYGNQNVTKEAAKDRISDDDASTQTVENCQPVNDSNTELETQEEKIEPQPSPITQKSCTENGVTNENTTTENERNLPVEELRTITTATTTTDVKQSPVAENTALIAPISKVVTFTISNKQKTEWANNKKRFSENEWQSSDMKRSKVFSMPQNRNGGNRIYRAETGNRGNLFLGPPYGPYNNTRGRGCPSSLFNSKPTQRYNHGFMTPRKQRW